MNIQAVVRYALREFDLAFESRAAEHVNDFLAAGKRADEIDEIMADWHEAEVLPRRREFEASIRRRLGALRES